jgi:general secretion pathway protein K
MNKHKDNQKGIALMAVLWVLVILIALATEFAYSMKMEVNTTRNYKEDAESYYLSKAGINLALAELFKDARFHSIHEEYGWITGNILPVATGTELPPTSVTQDRTEKEKTVQDFDIVNRTNIELQNGTVTYTIQDENGKISINSANKNTLNKLLELSGVEEKIEQNTISDSILDWIDADKTHRLNGAEDDYYRKQNPPYFSKNREIETFDELLKIRGMTKEILYGSTDGVKKYKGIINHLTIYKIPKVNPNTAHKEVLDVLFEPEEVDNILGNIYKKGFHSDTLSNFFRIKSTGKITGSNTEHSVEVVVEKSIKDGIPKMVIHYWNDNVLNL